MNIINHKQYCNFSHHILCIEIIIYMYLDIFNIIHTRTENCILITNFRTVQIIFEKLILIY